MPKTILAPRTKPATAEIDLTPLNPTFVADVAGAYHVRLVVNDGQASSAQDTVVITTINRAPSANAGAAHRSITADRAVVVSLRDILSLP